MDAVVGELIHLQRLRVPQPISYSPWAASIVKVRQRNGLKMNLGTDIAVDLLYP